MRLRASLSIVLVLAGCGGVEVAAEFGDADVVASADEIRVGGVLAFINSEAATVEVLDFDVGLDARAARGIASHVRGRDARFGTRDDNPFDTIAELDAIAYVG